MRGAISYRDFESAGQTNRRAAIESAGLVLAGGRRPPNLPCPFPDVELENFSCASGRPRRGTRRIGSPEWKR